MRLVVDTNIVFSALIVPGRVRRVFHTPLLSLYAPDILLDELWRHREKMERYIEGWALREILSSLPRRIRFRRAPRNTLAKAVGIISSIDLADAPFIALAMHLGVPLWTGDKKVLRLAVETGFRDFRAVDTRGVDLLLVPAEAVVEAALYLRTMDCPSSHS